MLLFTTGTHAAGLGFWQKLDLVQACGAEIETTCGGIEPGEGRLAQCVRDGTDKLSEPCQAAIDKLKTELAIAADMPMDY